MFNFCIQTELCVKRLFLMIAGCCYLLQIYSTWNVAQTRLTAKNRLFNVEACVVNPSGVL